MHKRNAEINYKKFDYKLNQTKVTLNFVHDLSSRSLLGSYIVLRIEYKIMGCDLDDFEKFLISLKFVQGVKA